jgi:hypothetical protein
MELGHKMARNPAYLVQVLKTEQDREISLEKAQNTWPFRINPDNSE